VISISFKDVSGDRYEEVIEQLRGAVCEACDPHEKVLKESGILSEEQLKILQSYLDGNASDGNLRLFLKYLPLWLFKATHKKVVILLDEYDVPLQKAAIYDIHNPGSKLFDETVGLIGRFISAGFKSNNNLAYGIIAGCMRVAKESIFTGMNNPGVITVVDEIPDEFWGFTQKEVEDMLNAYSVKIKNLEGYDHVFVANMGTADYLDSSIPDEAHLAKYIKNVLDDPDGYDGIAFNRWYADTVKKGVPVIWEDML
jgi:hypothetical protein